MNRFALFLTVLLLAEMAYDAIDRVLAPYEPLFWQWGGYAVVAFLCWLMIRARRHRAAVQGKGPARRG